MEGYARDIACMAFECEDRIRVTGFDIVQLDIMVAGCGEIALIGSYAETVYLGVGMLNCAGAYSGECFPEPVNVSGVLRSRRGDGDGDGDGNAEWEE